MLRISTVLVTCLLGIGHTFVYPAFKYIEHFPSQNKKEFKKLKKINPILALFMEDSQNGKSQEQLKTKMEKLLTKKPQSVNTIKINKKYINDPTSKYTTTKKVIYHWNSITMVVETSILAILAIDKVQKHIKQCSDCQMLEGIVKNHCDLLNNKNKEKTIS